MILHHDHSTTFQQSTVQLTNKFSNASRFWFIACLKASRGVTLFDKTHLSERRFSIMTNFSGACMHSIILDFGFFNCFARSMFIHGKSQEINGKQD